LNVVQKFFNFFVVSLQRPDMVVLVGGGGGSGSRIRDTDKPLMLHTMELMLLTYMLIPAAIAIAGVVKIYNILH